MLEGAPNSLRRYGLALAIMALATGGRAVLPFGEGVPFILYYPAVVVIGWFGGFGPAMLATGLSSLIAYFYFFPRETAFSFEAVFRTIIFATAGVVISALAEQTHRSRKKLLENESRIQSSLQAERDARIVAEDANRLKDEFLATISHELRTPLTSILGWVYVLKQGGLDSEKAQQGLQAIERNSVLQAKIVSDLLDVSRIITGQLQIEASLVDAAPIVESVMESVRVAAAAKNIRLICSPCDANAKVFADPARLQQIVWNLLSNAVKFTPNGGTVTVSFENKDEEFELVVRDNGEGIAPEFLPHVFERFRQADASQTRGHGGMGLGLAVVRHVVELHGGFVSVESPGLGLGARFTVRLRGTAPLQSDPPSPQRSWNLSAEPKPLRNS